MFAVTRRLEGPYRETDYRVGAFVLRIGGSPRPVARLLRRHRRGAFIVAANPGSRILPRAVNVRRDTRLRARLRQAGFSVVPGTARHPGGDWPAEPGVLALGIAPSYAAAFGRLWAQNAVVLLRRDAPPRLFALR